MKPRSLRAIFICVGLAAAMGFTAFAQSKPPGGPPPGGYGPGGPMGPGGSGGARPPVSNSSTASSAARSGFQFGPVGRWWDDKTVIQAIGLRTEQKQKMDTIFNANKPAILSSYKTFLKEQSKLNALNKNPHVDQTQLFLAIDAVNQARASLQKATSQMLLQIRQEMNAEQIQKLEKLK